MLQSILINRDGKGMDCAPAHIFGGEEIAMPQTLDELLRHAELVVDEINNHKQDMVRRAVRKMKEKAQACGAVGGGLFEGRKL